MNDEQKCWLEDLLDLEQGMSDWELNFVEYLSHRNPDAPLSERQAKKLEEIWMEHCR